MQKPQSTRHWKQVHRLGVQSNSSLNSSINSNHSSLSAGYNRFQFQRTSVEKDKSKKNAMFQFTARNRDNPHDVSTLKRQNQTTPRTPKVRTQQQILSMEDVFRRMSTCGFEKDTRKIVRTLLKEVKNVMDMLRSTVDNFKKQYQALRWEWNHTIKILMAKEVSLEGSAVRDLQKRLDEKEREIQKWGKQSSFWERNGGTGNNEIRHQFKAGSRGEMRSEQRGYFKGQTYNSLVESPLRHLNISKVVHTKNNDNLSKLSRNNTIQSLLGPQPSPPFIQTISNSHPLRPGQDVQGLRDRLSRMREALGC